MKLFELSFPNADICSKTDLYYRSESCQTDCVLQSGQRATFDTFFNVFSCGKYLRHTVVKEVRLVLDIEGAAEISLFHVDGKVKTKYCFAEDLSQNRGATVTAAEQLPPDALREELISQIADVDTNRRQVSLTFDISQYPTGYIYFAIKALGDFKLYGGSYDTQCPTHDVKIGLVICTYKREVYVKHNVEIIDGYLRQNPDLRDKIEVFVIDNGHTLSPQDVPTATLVQNKNLGGSGGFTRGMMEVCHREGFTHVLLSDDDVVYQPSMFRKTVTLLQTAKNPTEMAVGAAMLKLDKPNIQHEFGAQWSRTTIGHLSYGQGFDLTKQAALFKNEQDNKVDYSAWWYCCMPLCKVRENGYSLPLFIKNDDIEYGVRCKFEFALINGIGLWHEPFEGKYSPFLEYYVIRNLLISSSTTRNIKRRRMFKRIMALVSLQLVYQRYEAADFIFAACNDFFKGGKFLLNADGEQLNKKLIAANPKQQKKQQLQRAGYNLEEIYTPRRKKTFLEVVTLNGYMVPVCFYPKQSRKYRVIDLRKYYPQQFYKVKRVVQYNPATETGFVTEQKFVKLFSTGFRLVGLWFKMLFCYRKAVKSYRDCFDQLTSEENWKKLLELQ